MQAPVRIDEYGEAWVVIDGIETKVPSIKQARATLARQDAVRLKIRADLDALGIRDKTEKVEITLEDGSKDTVELLPPGAANVLQIGNFETAEALQINADHAQRKLDEAERLRALAAERKRLAARPPLTKIRDAIMSFLRKDKP